MPRAFSGQRNAVQSARLFLHILVDRCVELLGVSTAGVLLAD
jgi:hypothetical protein